MPPVRPLLATLALLGALLPPVAARAQSPPLPAADAAYGDLLSVHLVTMGNGDQVWEKFGHNAIWIQDPVAGTDRVYNYGAFDFDAPDYWSRFVKGDWLYQLAVSDMESTLYAYRYFDRTVVAQELNLSGAQKAELQAFLEWNARPENRDYLYDYFRDNCSTRVRDVLDRVLDGRLRDATAGVPTETSFRWHSRRLLALDPLPYAGLGMGLGPATDRPISQWEEMFLPEKVRQRAAELQVELDGRRVPLVASERVLYEAAGRPAEPEAPPFAIPVFLLIGLTLAAALAGLAAASPRHRGARVGFAALAGLWTAFAGVGGLLLAGLWGLTNHVFTYGNENLLQIDPLALPLVLLLPALAYGARWAARPARLFAYAAAGASFLGFVAQALPGLDQVNGEVVALMLPPYLALAWAARRLSPDARPVPDADGKAAVQRRAAAA